MPCGLSIIKEEWKSERVGEWKRGRGEEWGWEKSPFFLFPDIRRANPLPNFLLPSSGHPLHPSSESVAELPS